MGTSGSKPDWYPGEPADNFKAPPCSCSHAPQCAADNDVEAEGGSPPISCRETHSGCGGGGLRKEAQERDITRLPVVTLTDMKYIANGAFCAVYACKYRGWSVVAKRVRHDLPLRERQAALANLWTEYDCLRKLRHPNVIDVYGMCRVRCREDYDDWNEKDVCLLVEQLAFGTIGHLFGTIVTMEKNLATAMSRSRKMKMVPFRCRLHRALELAQALEYMHGGSGMGAMMHRDIKSVNVGFAKNGSLKLIDFGLSKIAPASTTVDDTYKMTGEVGSYRYMAPELVKHEPYNIKVDIYSWAILSWEILAIDKPYAGIGESTFIQKVVVGGDRPEFRKSWPDRLCKLLAAAWHADHTKRPLASEIVSTLKLVEKELSPKDKRRPSYAASAVTPGGSSSKGGGGSGGGGGGANRRHSWTQMSSTDRSTVLSLTRLSSGSGTESEIGTTRSTDQIPPLSSSASSPVSEAQPQKKKKRASLPALLPRTSSAPPRRRSLRWLSACRKSSFASPSGPTPPEEEVMSALQGISGGGSGGYSGSAGSGSGKEGYSPNMIGPPNMIVVGAVDREEQREEGGTGDATDRGPEWATATATAAAGAPAAAAAAAATAAGAAAAATTRADGGGCGGGRCCQLRQTIITQRELISDALARETEGLLSSGGGARPSNPRTATTTATKAVAETETEDGLTLGDANQREARDHQATAATGGGGGTEDKGDGSGVAVLPVPGRRTVAMGVSGEEEGTPGSTGSTSNGADSQAAAKINGVPRSSSMAPAGTEAAKKVVVAPDVPRPMRRNSGIGKLWPSASSSALCKDNSDASPAAEEVVGTQPVISRAISTNGGGGMEDANGTAETTTE